MSAFCSEVLQKLAFQVVIHFDLRSLELFGLSVSRSVCPVGVLWTNG